ncbi:ArsR/SmtB family transcription factor [Natronococcus roseus]|uniref:ArsR/SmtB family transcription factor n=1 Tax=Natronococcus roseus TaxID=1052014 RepID=UPI00374DA80E
MLDALSSETSRAVFRELNEQPSTPAALADRLKMSIQRVSYHLENLTEAGLIEVADTCYSEKGREMNVYTVTGEPLVVFLGTEGDQPGLRAAFKRLSASVGPLAAVFALWETIVRYLGVGDTH